MLNRRPITIFVGALGTALIAATCIGSGTTIQQSVPVATSLPATAIPNNYGSNLEKTIVQYYTEGAGQQHFDNSIYHDLLLTRHYIYNKELNQYGIVVTIHGVISGFRRVEDVNGLIFQFDLKEFKDQQEAEPYVRFVEKTLQLPEIDYRTAPRMQGLSAILKAPGNAKVAIGLVGRVPNKAPVIQRDVFEQARQLSEASSQLPEERWIFSIDADGTLLYVGNPHLSLSWNRQTQIFRVGEGFQELPVQGAAMLEQVILDTQAPENRELLKQLGAQMPLIQPGNIPLY